MSASDSSMSVCWQQTPHRTQRIRLMWFWCYFCLVRGRAGLVGEIHKVYVEHFCPGDVAQGDADEFADFVGHVLDEAAFAKVAFLDGFKVDVDDDGAVFEVQIDVFAYERFGAVEAEAFHRLPLHFLVCQVGPALAADGAFFAFKHDVEFDVFALAGVFPWVLTMFHVLVLQ